ncbi:Tetratricopeptide repeat-containing protein [Aquimarina amphilecti]|uniref:Tetratricopeptide repeat-containing protein n=1 Tax=Aquimarina amphilecti TaxID=1038014 RepID=A0A1H7WH67_AQUAM|nr:tetratricopeptide repeat protein [Aquimarina amphilecti]SEM20810.1 Tetratricopeptide repeat-containing protein [Aquimarina amphilecti]
MFKDFASRKFEIFILMLIIGATIIFYIGHFDNPFFFDDKHTISENESIRSLKNWTDFFTDADTFSSLPANRAYRPMITLMNAIDYSLAGGLKSTYFHYHIFFWFLVLIILVYLLTKHIYEISEEANKYIGIIAFFGTAWFALHTANAETINYICARSDSFSTLCIVISLLLYIHPFGRKWFLYLITMIIGIWTKQTGVMFFPILSIYILLFEEESLLTSFKTNTASKIYKYLKKIAPAGIIAISLFVFNQYFLTPSSTHSTNYDVSRFEYFSTQWYVTIHYLGNFILPVNLSADPDLAIIKPWYHFKNIFGLLIIVSLFVLMIKTSFNKKLRPISFGIAWFFIALLPTAINPLFQIANDHRTFFPYIGLFIAIPYGTVLLLKKLELFKKYKTIVISISILIFIAHGIGVIKRTEVWSSPETLWYDVTEKSPKNGRGLMNYGLTHMAKGDYENALLYFNKALKLLPNYYVLHINLGILYHSTNNEAKAIEHFKKALNLNSSSPDPEYCYAIFLIDKERYIEAEKYLNLAIQKSPNHIRSKELLAKISGNTNNHKQEITKLENNITNNNSLENYIELSLRYYDIKNYEKVIETCKIILKLDPKNINAYNNLCAAYNQLKKWELGEEACKKALEIDPDFQLAKNNLRWATDNINK